MASLQRALYGESVGGWDGKDHRPSASELAWHSDALRRDLGCGVLLVSLFIASAALLATDVSASEELLRNAAPGSQLWRGALGLFCALAAGSALATDLLLCPCPARSDPKYRAIRPIGHFAYLTVQCLSINTVHLSLSALADASLDPLVTPHLPDAATRAFTMLHTACHMHAEWVATTAIMLAVLYYPMALLLPVWEIEEVQPWRNRGVSAFKPLNLYSHGAAIPAALADLVLIKNRHVLARLAPPFAELAAVAVGYSILYPLSVHLGYNLHSAHTQRLKRAKAEAEHLRHAAEAHHSGGGVPRAKSHPEHAWPYGFMDELTLLGQPPPALHGWGVRPPFSGGWVILCVFGMAVHLCTLAVVRRMHVGA
jgi:hypothetical protein